MVMLLTDIFVSSAFLALYTIRKIQFLFTGKKSFLSKPDILFSNDCTFWRKYVHSDGRLYADDVIIGGIIAAAKERGLTVRCVDVGMPRRSYRESGGKFDEGSDWECLERFATWRNLLLAYWLSVRWWLGFRSSTQECELLGVTRQTQSRFRQIFAQLTARHLLDILQPRCVFMGCEYLHMSRALSRGARQRGILVGSIQHGDISHGQHGYFFDDDIRSRMQEWLPHYTFVFAQRVKDILVEGSIYEEDMVVVSGNPRYDVIAYANEIYSKERTVEKYDLPEGKQYVLWTAQCRTLTDEANVRMLRCIRNSARELDGTVVVVKRHPSEGKKYTDIITKYLEMPNDDIVMVPHKSDTNELIHACDLLFTRNSTTSTDAAAQGKPVIELDLEHDPQESMYVQAGIAVGVGQPEDFAPTVRRLLDDDSELVENRARYIESHLYRIDGQAAARVADFLRDALEGRK